MIEAIKYSASGDNIGKVELPETLFAVTCNNPNALLYEVINMYRANQRQGTVCKQTRGEVQGSTRKLFAQKGSGRARMGNLRTPLRHGGGLAFPPRPHDWSRPIPTKKKRLALKIALSMKAKLENICLVESINFAKPSTKQALDLIRKIAPEKGRKLLVINDSNVSNVNSFANIPDVDLDRADRLFAYEVLRCKYLIITVDALEKIQEVFVK